jgi:hypothetical protein
MDSLNIIGLSSIIILNQIRTFLTKVTFTLVDYARKLDGDLYIWSDGRSSTFAPVLDEDKNCWHYDSLKQSLIYLGSENESNVRKRWGWLAGVITIGGKSIDFSDHLTDLFYCSPANHPTMQVVRTLLMQKLGFVIGDSAIFCVTPRGSVIDEKIFKAGLQTEEDQREWEESWA